MKDKSVGYVTGHVFGGWNIPQKVQTAIMHYNAKNNDLIIAYMIPEYMDSKKNDILYSELKSDSEIKNIFFTSALQIIKNNNKLFNILKKYNLYFFLENIVISKSYEHSNLKKYINDISNRNNKSFLRKNYMSIFEDYKNFFK